MILRKPQIDKMLQQLTGYRVNEILLVATRYESFILEKDGHLVEQIHQEFSELNLKYLPRITRTSTTLESLKQLKAKPFDLVITMHNLQDNDAFELAKLIKQDHPQIPVVMLLSDPSYLSKVEAPGLTSILDGVFFWSGDPSLFLAIIKIIEDRFNVSNDVKTELVKAILVVDDSIQYYSKFLPVVYGEVMRQTQALIKEGLNEFQKTLYMRTRPKILLASNYEDAMQLFEMYRDAILGVISDIAYPKDGVITQDAGLQFVTNLRRIRHDLPMILMSAEDSNAIHAAKLGVTYVNKNSPSFPNDLKNFIISNMGFGDFVFRMPDGKEVGRANNLKEFQRILSKIPPESLIYHAQRNHISTWLTAHGRYDIALELRPRQVSDFGGDAKKMADFLIEAFNHYRESEQTGQVVKYRQGDWDSDFIQVGGGSLGGKARGIAFMNYLLANTDIPSHFPNIKIKIPKTIGIGVEEFDYFLDRNRLKDVLFLHQDSFINQKFLEVDLSEKLKNILADFLREFRQPVVVRSSSLLEDSQFLPFAGVSSYILPNNHPDFEVRFQQLLRAIKLIYASVFSTHSKVYIANTPYKIQEVKMGIVIQELVGQTIGKYVYPSFAGIAQSYNYYPFSYLNHRGMPQILDPKQGSAQVAMGFSRMVMESGQTIRFCPHSPELVNIASESWRSCQTSFYALDLEENNPHRVGSSLTQLDIAQADPELLQLVCSTYNTAVQILQDDPTTAGPQVVTFSKVLRKKAFPLGSLLTEILQMLKESMLREVEIEFAVNLHDPVLQKPTFYLLQVRPLLLYREWAFANKQDSPLWGA